MSLQLKDPLSKNENGQNQAWVELLTNNLYY